MLSRFLGVGQQPSPPKKKQREIRLNFVEKTSLDGEDVRLARAIFSSISRINETINRPRRPRERRGEEKENGEGSLTGLSLSLVERRSRRSSGEDRPISINRDRRRRRGCRESNLRDRPRKVTSQLAPCHPVRPADRSTPSGSRPFVTDRQRVHAIFHIPASIRS